MKKWELRFWILAFVGCFILYGVGIETNKQIQKLKEDNTVLKQNASFLTIAMGYMEDYENKLLDPPIYDWPVAKDDFKYLTSPFGLRDIPKEIYTGGSITRDHKGVDFAGTYQARIIAVSDGIIVDNYLPPGYHNGVWYKGHPVLGGMIKIKHDDGRYSVYGHLSRVYVHEGQRVKKGQVIGRMGNTGISTGQHLHFELHDNNDQVIQPLLYLKDPNDEKK